MTGNAASAERIQLEKIYDAVSMQEWNKDVKSPKVLKAAEDMETAQFMVETALDDDRAALDTIEGCHKEDKEAVRKTLQKLRLVNLS